MNQEKFAKIVNSLPIPRKIPISVASGVAVILIFWGFTITSLLFFPGYNPLFNWMSDLGNSMLNPLGAKFFNIGCILSGIALAPFFFGLYEWYIGGKRNKRLTILTQICGVFASLSMVMIGVFPEDILALHIFWAMILFTLTIFTFILPSIALYKFKFTRNIARYGIIATTINMILWVFITPILEWITIIFSFGFIILIIHSMYKRIEKFRFIRANLKQYKTRTGKKTNNE